MIVSNAIFNNVSGSSGGNDGAGLIIISGHSTDATYANGVTIAGNNVHDNHVDGMQIHGQYFTVNGNTVRDNLYTDWAAVHPDGIQLNAGSADGFTSVQHAKISNNVFKNQTQNVFLEGSAGGASSDCRDISIWNNVLYMDSGTLHGVNLDTLAVNSLVIKFSRDVRVYNNTFGSSGSNAIFVQSGFDGSISIKNNIIANGRGTGIYVDTPSNVPSGGLDYNQYYTASSPIVWGATFYSSRTAFHAAVSAQETHGQDGNPLINPFPTPMPQATSPVLGKGTNLSASFPDGALDISGVARGSVWTIGAYQTASGALQSPSTPSGLHFIP